MTAKYHDNYGGKPKMNASDGSTLKDFGPNPQLYMEHPQFSLYDELQHWYQLLIYSTAAAGGGNFTHYIHVFLKLQTQNFDVILPLYFQKDVLLGETFNDTLINYALVQHPSVSGVTIVDYRAQSTKTYDELLVELGINEFSTRYFWQYPFQAFGAPWDHQIMGDCYLFWGDHYTSDNCVMDNTIRRKILRQVWQYQRSFKVISPEIQLPQVIIPDPEPTLQQDNLAANYGSQSGGHPIVVDPEPIPYPESWYIGKMTKDFKAKPGYKAVQTQNRFINIPQYAWVDSDITYWLWRKKNPTWERVLVCYYEINVPPVGVERQYFLNYIVWHTQYTEIESAPQVFEDKIINLETFQEINKRHPWVTKGQIFKDPKSYCPWMHEMTTKQINWMTGNVHNVFIRKDVPNLPMMIMSLFTGII